MVELHPAYMWDCPECGAENFERGVIVEMDEEGIQALRRDYGVEDAVTGDFMMAPEEVTCRKCGKEFTTEDQRGRQ